MRALLVLVLFASSCAAVDVLDGHIDDPDHCCIAGTKNRVRECMVKFHDGVANDCWAAQCGPPIGYVEAFLDVDGEIRNECPPEFPPAPF